MNKNTVVDTYHVENNHIDFKPSMFNRVVKKGTDMIIFNSKTGPAGIRYVSEQHKEQVEKLLSQKRISETDDSPVRQSLIECGFIVPFERNEKEIREYLQTKILTDSRLHLVIHTSKDCNFRCKYCYMDFKQENIRDDTKSGIINFVRKNIQNYKSVHISWFGGEPLLNMDAIRDISKELMSICEKAKRPYSSSVTTNGYLLTPQNIDILLASKVRNLFITIDGIKELHDTQRILADGSPSFDTIIQNLLYIKNNIATRALAVSIRTNMTKNHLDTLHEYYSFYDDLFGDDDRFSLYAKPVGNYGGARVLSIKDDLLNGMNSIYETLAGTHGKIKFFWNINDLCIGSGACPSRRFNKFTIGCDGSVHKCDEDVSGHPIGHLYPDGNMELNEEEHAKWLYIRKNDRCDNCFLSPVCFMEGCPKSRVFFGENVCEMNMKDIDSLIWWTAQSINAKSI